MNNVKSIREEIEKDAKRTAGVKAQVNVPNSVEKKPDPHTIPATMPGQNLLRTTGVVLSIPGSEKIILDASTFQLMECDASAHGINKHRYCVVEKNVNAMYGNQFCNSQGWRTHIITKDLFDMLHGIFNVLSLHIQTLNKDLKTATESSTLYKATIDALRKNGVID